MPSFVTTWSPLNTPYCWKNTALCKTVILGKINLLTKELSQCYYDSSMLLSRVMISLSGLSNNLPRENPLPHTVCTSQETGHTRPSPFGHADPNPCPPRLPSSFLLTLQDSSQGTSPLAWIPQHACCSALRHVRWSWDFLQWVLKMILSPPSKKCKNVRVNFLASSKKILLKLYTKCLNFIHTMMPFSCLP